MFTLDELERANIPRLKIAKEVAVRTDVPSMYLGCIEFRDGTIATFCRERTSWVVKLSVTIDGFSTWEVETQEDLNALVQNLKAHFGEIAIPLSLPSLEWLATQEMVSSAICG